MRDSSTCSPALIYQQELTVKTSLNRIRRKSQGNVLDPTPWEDIVIYRVIIPISYYLMMGMRIEYL